MMRVFVSQGMNGKTDEEIKSQRNRIERAVSEGHQGEDIEFVDSYFEDYDGSAVKFLAKSIGLLATADLVVFQESEWKGYRGCRIEHMVAEEYGIAIEMV